SDAMGKARTIQVEVRKKRVFVKRDPSELAAAAAAAELPPPAPAPAPAPAAVSPAAPAGPGAKELQLREEEYRRQQQLSEIQAAELREKQEREKRDDAQKQAERAAPAPEVAAKEGTGTLHAPKAGEPKSEKKAKKVKQTTILRDDSARRRTIKTRGAMGGGVGGWHGRGGARSRSGSPATGEPAFAQPTEPVVREIAVPETIPVGELATTIAGKG